MTDRARSLDGKRVIVIGGASGIGLAVATLSRGSGAEVVIASSQAAHVEAAVARLSGTTGRVVDVRDEASVSGFFGELGEFDHLAFTAGDWGGGMVASARGLDLAASRDGFDVRFWGALAAVKHGSRRITPNGSITLTSGMLAHRPMRGMPLATAMAGAVEHLTRGLAIDLAPVRINAVCPGLILTDAVRQMPEEMVRTHVAGLPLPRAGSPEEAATAYVYLMLNSYATGQILPVDGGGCVV